MKLTTTGLTLGMLIAGWGTATLRAQPAAETTPASTNADLKAKIQFAEPIHDFGKVKVNEPVKCDFIFTNTGKAVLEISAVNPGCGCTHAGEWPRRVESGKTGAIPIQFNAAGNPGPFSKVVNVTCNDPDQQTVVLQIKGVLWKPIDVNPQYAMFTATAEAMSNATSVVRIINNEETPLTLSAPEITNPGFTAEVKTKEPGKEFEVTIRPVPPVNENAHGVIILKSSSSNMPVIHINATARLQPSLVVNPPSIMLPPAPNTNNVRPVIHVRNNGIAPFSLSNPIINAEGVDIQIKEIEPGKYASLTLTFPPDFTVTPEKNIHLSVKTGLPHTPNLDVPVFQRPRRVAN